MGSRTLVLEGDITTLNRIIHTVVTMGRIAKKGGCEAGKTVTKKIIVPTDEDLDNLLSSKDEEWDEVFYPSQTARKSKGKIFEKAMKSLSSKSFKIKKNKGGCSKAEKVTTALKSAISLVPGVKNFLVDQFPHALEQVHDSIPVALNYILPIALKNVLPGGIGNVASQSVASKLAPLIQQKVYPKVVSRCIPEDILYEIAVKRSLEDCEATDEKGSDLTRFKF